MRVGALLSDALSSRRARLHLAAVTLAAATVGAVTPLAIGAAAASADPATDAAPAVVTVDLTAPATVTRSAATTLLAKVTLTSIAMPDRTVQFVRRPVGATSWQVLGSATTGQDGTTTFPVASVTAPTQYAAYYADSAASPVRSHPATAIVHVLDVLPTAPKKVAYNARVTVGAKLVQDGAHAVARQPVQVQFRTRPHTAWGAPRWLMTDRSGTAHVTARFPHTFQVGVRFPGVGALAPSPLKVTTVQVTPKPAVSSDGFRFPLLNAASATPPGTWSLDQGVDLFAAGHACGDAAKEVAVADGTVIQTGIAGFGPTAPVIRMSSGPFKGRNVYYGHTGKIFVHVGQQVRQGDLVAEIGCGRVGISSTPHLEIGVGVPGGPPCCPGFGQTAGLMMRELVASLHAG